MISEPSPEQIAAPAIITEQQPTGRERAALRLLQLGALAVVLAVTTWKTFELDRFFVAKELALHISALGATLLLIHRLRRLSLTKVDLLLIGYLGASLLSLIFATNHWLGLRAFTLSASGLAIFWSARALRESGLARPLLGALALAVIVGALSALLQAYGLRTDLFSINRAPGGTLGNRNFVAHMAAFGLPVVLLAALQARHRLTFVMAGIGAALLTASVIITRSRAGYLAFGVVLIVLALALVISPALRRDRRTRIRIGTILALAAAAAVAAMLVPNALRWNSENPYLESISSVANYQEGSGRGRLVQYRQSLRMTARNPVVGVGPGNWAVEYPAHAARRDPSLNDNEGGTTSNPWPSSDWIAYASERGVPAVLLLALALLLITFSALKQLARAPDAEQALPAAILLATIAAFNLAGAFNAVMLLALPTLLVWATLGALWTPAPGSVGWLEPRRNMLFRALAVIVAIGVVRSSSQLVAMGIYAASSNRSALTTAALVDPGNYRLRVRLARMGNREQRCRHARAAHNLYPRAAAARSLSRGCND